MLLRKLALPLLFATLTAAQVAPCTEATVACREPVHLGADGRFVAVYRSFALTRPNQGLRLAYIMIHGSGRNADHYFSTALASTFLAGRLSDTLVLAPRFAGNDGLRCKDALEPGEIGWNCNGWVAGERAADDSPVHSYDLIDRLLEMLANREVFPNLKRIVLAGHSAGGQFGNRYAAAGRGPTSLPVPIHYVVSNPSSYLYLESVRPAAGAKCTEKGDCAGGFTAFADAAKCEGYNRWRYGLEKRSGYTASLEEKDLRSQLASREVTYLLGALDTLPIGGFDSSCAAMAQGSTRLERGLAYWNYVKSRLSASHRLVTVPMCGHNGRCMFTADQALRAVFSD